MRRAISAVTSLVLLAATAQSTRAVEATWEYSVQLSATVQAKPAQITLSWPQDTVTLPDSYTLYRKAPADTNWGQGIVLPASTTSFTDTNLQAGIPYEYQIVKETSLYTGYGYIYTGIRVPMAERRGKLLLVVDGTYATDLAPELARLRRDLVGDGWTVIRLDVNRNDPVTKVKELIKAQYTADPTHVKCVFLFGHVPVPYSGDIVPDGHVPGHCGAWPCDGYYGDMDGEWTDVEISDSGANDPRNRNVPGDGKFDQSLFPAPIKLMVGRVDLANLPGRKSYNGPPTFPSEADLLRNYLDKDHKFRTRQFELPCRAILGDYFGVRNGEAFAASGYRNFAAFVGATNITPLFTESTWIPTLGATPYLWAYACGDGTFTSIAGIGSANQYNDGTSPDIMRADLKATFTLLFGSWLGDWDSEDNLMRTVLALPSYALTCAWSGRPHWFLQSMALGQPIGYGTRLTQNNGPDGLYKTQVNNGAGQIHIALMGDPTLRMVMVAPPTSLTATATSSAVTLDWAASADAPLIYRVYRAPTPNGPFVRLNTEPVTGTRFTDSHPATRATYMVRAMKLETSASGTYYNLSEGVFVTVVQ